MDTIFEENTDSTGRDSIRLRNALKSEQIDGTNHANALCHELQIVLLSKWMISSSEYKAYCKPLVVLLYANGTYCRSSSPTRLRCFREIHVSLHHLLLPTSYPIETSFPCAMRENCKIELPCRRLASNTSNTWSISILCIWWILYLLPSILWSILNQVCFDESIQAQLRRRKVGCLVRAGLEL